MPDKTNSNISCIEITNKSGVTINFYWTNSNISCIEI